ncbi:hybrid sensor histidine kinase/response regulator [Nostoc sp. 'Peltigera membranacea cyanobiont' N6]|uniref:hybrid sensor histidine kinase/response regulator n=1 Tax=Nostoc sp. 'Peltigera membranacea cyanobiont' N6 TaxID=1261031 RepID=UPI000CF32485|nr:hybrid sensor histidine kinase/response regulator [Nostoc sp. 'Peltigera membranacea cyanobiont' N6]AVH65586.1 response regulator receiver sensor signal transduction histidine kinase [Nostoc sp. 'Peltigera membranacea cyanobiont' N6]
MSLSKTVKKDKILVVDDIFDNLLVLEAVLEDEDYEISLVEDSKIALAMVEESPPDIILLDVMMPELDGYEFTRRIRQNQALPFIPILLLTAHYESSVVEGLDAGADDFIRKPFDPDELHARVRSLLRLKHSIDERDQMANLRADFVSRFTHDLRIPLVASNRVLKLLLEGRFCEVSPQLQEIINTMIGSNQDLLEMVNTLLEVYRHEAGCKTLKISPCNIQELVSEVFQELTPLAEEKGLSANIDRGETTITIMADRVELRRVLTNIIGNAIKFTDKGYVDIHCHLTPANVTIDIQDTGPGISKQDQAILFERFRQGKHQRSGSGLGLYLSRCIIEAHQGTIDVTSEPGQGSRFTIRLPVASEN